MPKYHRENLPYRSGVGIMLLNQQGWVLIAQRRDMPSETWQMPQGGLKKGEPPDQGAFRELKEEIGTDNAVILAETQEWLTYEFPNRLIPQLWGGRYRGQEQKWFVMRFCGNDDEINIHTENPEFSAWKWVPMAELINLIVPFKRPLYQRLVDNFSHLVAEQKLTQPEQNQKISVA